jgi:O-antigen ligase
VPVFALAYFRPVLTRRFLMAGTVVATGWAFAAREFFLKYPEIAARLPASWRARLEIWDYMSYRIQEKPLFGWGLGTSHLLDFADPHGAQYVFITIPAAHPHNVMTELWVELGLPGLFLGVAFAFLTLRKAGRLDARLVPFALGCWTACFCLSLIAYDFWTDSLFAAFALTAFAFVILERQIRLRSSRDAPAMPR